MTPDDVPPNATPPTSLIHGQVRDGRGVVTLMGEIDYSNAARMDAEVRRVLGQGVALLVLDFGAVVFADSACLSALVRAREASAEAGVDLVLTGVGSQVGRILDMTGLTPLFHVADRT